ncbi:MAG: phage tail sheath C-terminal domain-containing protein [Terrimicrobiaceae bacterium]
MARPNISFRINDESMVVPITEGFSTTIGAVYNPTNNLRVLGNTAEKDAGYYLVPNISDWYSRLNDYITGLQGGVTFAAGNTFYSVGSCAASYLNGTYTATGGISAGFSGEWWAVNNFLQYGSACYVGFGNGLAGITAFFNVGFDVMFQGVSSANAVSAITSIIDYKASTDQPAIGVVYVPSATTTISSSSSFTTPSGTSTKEYTRVYGEKVHLDTTGLYSVTTMLTPDIAGCIVRTDRDYYPWFSPAGSKRGRILGVVRLARALAPTEQDILYDNGVNPVVTFGGEGTLLYGDKTGESASSTLSRINVSRLFMYIKKALAPVARSILFEQNDAITRSRFKIAAEGFLDRIVGQRGITEYKVICDSSNNTPEVIEANYFVADVLIKPVTSINYVRITLTNKDLSSVL